MYKKIIAISLIISMNLIFVPIDLIQNAEANTELNLESTYELQKRAVSENDLNESKKHLTEAQKKLSTDLLKLVDNSFLLPNESRYQLETKMTEQKQFIAKEDTITKINRELFNQEHDDLVYVYIYLKPNTLVDTMNPFVWQIINKDDSYHLVVALVEVKKLETIASLEQVRIIRTVTPPIVKSGSVVTEGDVIHQTDEVRNLYSQSGNGIKVGVISDGVDHLSDSQSTDDLPPNVNVLSNTVGGDEGTAMLEIIHDMVPDASLYFHDCGSNVSAFNSAIDDLVSAGVDVIVDDIGWIIEPFFEDGTIASHITSVLASQNIVYVSSAGNGAKKHYQGDYYDDGYDFHDFSRDPSSNDYLYLNIPNNGNVRIVLQWNESFGASSNDYDLYLFNVDGYGVLDLCLYTQNGDDDPLEYINYTNTTGSSIIAEIDVKNYLGLAETKTLEVFIYSSGGVYHYSNNIVAMDSIFGHPAVPGVIAVGAIDASDSGNDDIEDFSSQGPVTIIGEEQRAKPDVCGIDGVTVTGAGGFSNPFYGTSAAAPHIAAIAAQLWGRFPTATADEIRDQILDNSVDLGTTGFDYIYGYGRADALASFLNLLVAPVLAEVTPVPTPANDTTPDYTFSSTEAGTISYGGSCTSTATTATADNNTITLDTLSEGTYSDCTITVTDTDSNASNVLSVTSFTIDTTAPTSSITYSIDHAVKDTDIPTITATFNEDVAVSPVMKIGITYTGEISALVATEMTRTDATHYYYDLNVPAGNGTGTIILSTGTDLAGNVITSIPTSGATFTVDNTAPVNQDTVFDTSTSKQGGATVDIVSSGDADNNVWFAPLGTTSFTAGATMTIAGGTATTISAPADEGSYRLFVIDIAGNYSSPSTAILTVDDTASTIAEVIPVPTPTNDTTPDYTFSSTEAGTIAYGGSCTSDTTEATAGSNTITFSTLAEGTYSDCTITVTDATNNASNVLSVTSFTIDTTVPTVGIVFTDTSLIVAETSLVTFTFDEAITGFTNDDLTIANGTLTDVATTTAENDIWAATFTPTDDLEDAENIITIDQTGITDIAGNAGEGTTDSNNYAIDTKEPTVEVAMDSYAFKVGETTTVTFTFSEAPTDFTADDVTIGTGTIETITNVDLVYSATYTPTDNMEEATNVISVGIVWTDTAGNAPEVISSSPNYTVDTKEPTAGITYSIDHAVKNADTLTITATFNEVMKDDPIPQIAIAYDGDISNLTATEMTQSDTTHYYYDLDVPAGNGTGTITLSTGTDLAGNVITSIPTSGATFTVDNTAPVNQDTVFDTSTSKQGGTSVDIVSSGDADNNVWFAPLGTTSFTAGATMTTAGGTATTISAPADEGSYRLFVIDIAGNYSSPSTAILTVDDTGSTIAEVTPVPTPANDTTPSYTFSSTEAGTISYGGSCTSATTEATADDNTITFSTLAEGTYSDCTITVTDATSNASNVLSVTSFTIDTTIPIAYLTGPVEGDRTELVIRFNDALHADTLAISDRALLLDSISNDATGTSTPISVASEVNSVIWDNSDTDAPIATISISSTTFIEDKTIRINFVETAVKDLAGNAILNATNVDVVVLASTQIAATPTVTVNTTQTEVVITSPHDTSITVPSTVTNATIDINSLTTDNGDNITATLPEIALSVTTDTFATPIEVAIPTDTIITGPTGWNSIINVPTIESNSSVTATPDSGYTASVSSVIEIGYSDTELTFNKAVRLLIPGAAGKYVGYSRNEVFTKITTACSADTQIAGDSLAAGGNCKINVGSDLVIWTKHFTNFATYTQTVIQGGGGGGGGGGGAASGPTSVSSFNLPLSVLTTQTGTLNQSFSDSSSVTVEIPEGSVSQTTTFSAAQGGLTGGLTPTNTMGAILIGNAVFNVNAVNNSGQSVTSFSSDLTITLTVPDLAEVSDLGVYYYNRALDKWELIVGAEFDFTNKKVSFTANHLTRFAVFQIAGVPGTVDTEEGLIIEDSFWTLGRWVKKESITAVYFLDSSDIMHTYPNQSIWESYFGDDFSFVETISEEELNTYTLGVNVPYSSGSLFKMQAFPKVYMVGENGLIQWIKTEEKAVELYGDNWASLVHDLSTAFFMDYTVGTPIE